MKILIITKNWLGDVLFQLPAIDAIAHRYPEARITCMAPARCREILECHPSVEGVLIFDEKKEQRSFLARIRFAWKLRREGFDQVYLFHRSRTRAFLMWLAGVKERIGYARGRQWFLTKAIEEPSKPLHHVDYYLHMLTAIGIPSATNSCYRFYLPAETIRSAENMMKKHHLVPHRFVCFHLGANWGPKRWPVGNFARLADLVYERWKTPVVVTGSATG
ncbi:MAG: glycosyltransferase family 9 protein, partial [Candidatus Omnitrophica bacterium]|nr:glycosyltransferase family 9 protein [Candidatus Omnitrophota bacterium]